MMSLHLHGQVIKKRAMMQEGRVYYTDTSDEPMGVVVIYNGQDIGILAVMTAAQTRSQNLRLISQ
jgi:hypothetical protein